jgi:hypothetical protein
MEEVTDPVVAQVKVDDHHWAKTAVSQDYLNNREAKQNLKT